MLLSIMTYEAVKTQFLISLLFRLGYLYEMTHNFFSTATHQNNVWNIWVRKGFELNYLKTQRGKYWEMICLSRLRMWSVTWGMELQVHTLQGLNSLQWMILVMGFMCNRNRWNREQAFFLDLVKRGSNLFCSASLTKVLTRPSCPLFRIAGSQL